MNFLLFFFFIIFINDFLKYISLIYKTYTLYALFPYVLSLYVNYIWTCDYDYENKVCVNVFQAYLCPYYKEEEEIYLYIRNVIYSHLKDKNICVPFSLLLAWIDRRCVHVGHVWLNRLKNLYKYFILCVYIFSANIFGFFLSFCTPTKCGKSFE